MTEKISVDRMSYIDIIKAVGIISIVVGHCFGCYTINIPIVNVWLGRFVYSYHIMVFFFIAGFSFKKENCREPYYMVGKRLVKLAGLSFLYNTIFVLLHNTFEKLHIINAGIYGKKEIFNKIFSGFLFINKEQLLGAFWFLPMFFVAIALFFVCFSYSEKFQKPQLAHIFFVLFWAAAGLCANIYDVTWNYHIQTSLLGIPVIYAGYWCKCYWSKIKKYVTWYGGVISAITILGILSQNIGEIELSVNRIISPALFYPVTFLGIYFCMCIGKILDSNRYSQRVFVAIGKNSFHIMALHFLAFKIVDVLYSAYLHISDVERIAKFPSSDYEIKFMYVMAGIFLPLLIIKIWGFFRRLWSQRVGKYLMKRL